MKVVLETNIKQMIVYGSCLEENKICFIRTQCYNGIKPFTDFLTHTVYISIL